MKKFWLSILVVLVFAVITLPAQARVNYGKFEVVTDTTSNRLILEGDTITAEDSTASVQLIHKDGEWVIPAINWSESDTSGMDAGDGYLPDNPDYVDMAGNSLEGIANLQASTFLLGGDLTFNSAGKIIFNDSTELNTSPEKCSSGEALNTTGCENLQDSSSNEKPVSVSTTHTQWASGLSNEEVWKSVNSFGDTFVLERLEFRSKGDTTAADTASLRVYNEADTTSLVSIEVDGSTTPESLLSTGDTHTLQITNQTGNDLVASINMQGYYK